MTMNWQLRLITRYRSKPEREDTMEIKDKTYQDMISWIDQQIAAALKTRGVRGMSILALGVAGFGSAQILKAESRY